MNVMTIHPDILKAGYFVDGPNADGLFDVHAVCENGCWTELVAIDFASEAEAHEWACRDVSCGRDCPTLELAHNG